MDHKRNGDGYGTVRGGAAIAVIVLAFSNFARVGMPADRFGVRWMILVAP